jgi:hypothetical protein
MNLEKFEDRKSIEFPFTPIPSKHFYNYKFKNKYRCFKRKRF